MVLYFFILKFFIIVDIIEIPLTKITNEVQNEEREKRKEKNSKQGLLGVEGIDVDLDSKIDMIEIYNTENFIDFQYNYYKGGVRIAPSRLVV